MIACLLLAPQRIFSRKVASGYPPESPRSTRIPSSSHKHSPAAELRGARLHSRISASASRAYLTHTSPVTICRSSSASRRAKRESAARDDRHRPAIHQGTASTEECPPCGNAVIDTPVENPVDSKLPTGFPQSLGKASGFPTITWITAQRLSTFPQGLRLLDCDTIITDKKSPHQTPPALNQNLRAAGTADSDTDRRQNERTSSMPWRWADCLSLHPILCPRNNRLLSAILLRSTQCDATKSLRYRSRKAVTMTWPILPGRFSCWTLFCSRSFCQPPSCSPSSWLLLASRRLPGLLALAPHRVARSSCLQ